MKPDKIRTKSLIALPYVTFGNVDGKQLRFIFSIGAIMKRVYYELPFKELPNYHTENKKQALLPVRENLTSMALLLMYQNKINGLKGPL